MKASSRRNVATHNAIASELIRSAKALRGKVDLTPEHATGISGYLGLDKLESRYFLNLIYQARAGTPALKSALKEELRELRDSHRLVTERIAAAGISVPRTEIESQYFSSWIWAAVHVATSIEKLNDSRAIAQYLGLTISRVQAVLEQLQAWGLVRFVEGRWTYEGGSFHLPKSSTLTEANHVTWRQRATADIQKNSRESLHYTSVFTLSQADLEALKESILQSIEKGRKIIGPSKPEELMCLAVDLFRV